MKRSRAHLNNKGFSLIELIVVLAIMVVLVAMVFASSSILDGSYVKDAERAVTDYVAMARSKSMSVAAKSWYITVTQEDGEYVIKLYKETEEGEGEDQEKVTQLMESEKLGSKVTMSYGKDTKTTITSANELKMYFDASTGKVKEVKLGNNKQNINDGIGYIGIVSGTYDITLKVFYNTGKCERE